MKRFHAARFGQVFGTLLVLVLLVRFFPLAIEFMEGAALSIRRFWWLVLLIALGIWAIWTMKQSRD